MEPKNPSGSVRDLLQIIFKYKARMTAVFFAVVALAVLITFLVPPVYEAKSTLMVKLGREHIYRPELGEGRPSLFLTQEGAINSEIQILKSRDLLKKVVTEIGHEKMYGDMLQFFSTRSAPVEAAVMQFERDMRAENKMRSDVIQVSFLHRDPEIAAKAVNLLVNHFKEKHLQVFSGLTTPFLERQLAAYRDRLRDSEINVEVFKQKHRIYSIDEQRAQLFRRRGELDTALMNVQNQINELKQKQNFVRAHTDLESERSAAIDAGRNQLLALQLKERELLRKYKETSQTVRSVREEIRLVGDLLEQQKKKNTNLEILKIQADLNGLKVRGGNLSRSISRIDADIQALDAREREFQNLKRDLTVNESNYNTYLRKLEEARISDDMDRQKIANISVIQAASMPIDPVKPQKGYNLMLGAVLGALAALGSGFLSEYASQGLSSPEAVRKRLDLPVLASFPYKGAE